MLAVDRALAAHQSHWLVREIILMIKRTLKRLDLTARSLIAVIEPGSCFAGTLFELALAADRCVHARRSGAAERRSRCRR